MNGTLIRRAYDMVALLAVLHLLALGALSTYLIGSGTLTGERVQRIAAVLRGEEPAPVETPATEAKPAPPPPPPVGQSAEDAALAAQQDEEITRREAERIKAELDQRLATVNRVLLQVTKKREAWEQEVADANRRAQELNQTGDNEGFRKELEYFETLSPKVAVQHLLAKSNVDEAARILLALDAGKGKKIIEAAKRGNDLERMKMILQRLREVAPNRSAELESNG
ncbi:MAG TPA: hypothetical protein PKK06_04460 [Phycisphaerae bacterium]|nr:hypothetical protein [Phycisphaerae bacterium]HNU46158.1 hypothetical protein [Phycisphaerae bacterium]